MKTNEVLIIMIILFLLQELNHNPIVAFLICILCLIMIIVCIRGLINHI